MTRLLQGLLFYYYYQFFSTPNSDPLKISQSSFEPVIPCDARRAFLKTPKNISGPKNYLTCTMFITRNLIFNFTWLGNQTYWASLHERLSSSSTKQIWKLLLGTETFLGVLRSGPQVLQGVYLWFPPHPFDPQPQYLVMTLSGKTDSMKNMWQPLLTWL